MQSEIGRSGTPGGTIRREAAPATVFAFVSGETERGKATATTLELLPVEPSPATGVPRYRPDAEMIPDIRGSQLKPWRARSS
jgi:hypothetical protein